MSERNLNGLVGDAAEQAKETAASTARTVKNAAVDAADRTQEVAREAGRQATAAAQNLYSQGNDLLAMVDRAVVENPFAALLIAGAVGFGIAMVTRRR